MRALKIRTATGLVAVDTASAGGLMLAADALGVALPPLLPIEEMRKALYDAAEGMEVEDLNRIRDARAFELLLRNASQGK